MRRFHRLLDQSRTAAVAGALLLLPAVVAAASADDADRSGDVAAVPSASSPEISRDGGWSWRLLPGPEGRLFVEPAADVEGSRFGMTVLSVEDPDLEEAGDRRLQLELGGRFALLHGTAPGGRLTGLRVEVEAGFQGQFDPTRNYDNLGWDGVYGLWLSTSTRGGVGWRIGLHHVSSHVGDEYAEATGRRRIEYTREELVLETTSLLTRRIRAFAEIGRAWELRNEEIQRPLRARVGLERFSPPRFFAGRAGWFAALDLASWEERSWDLEIAAQAGLWLPAADRRWRLGVAFHDGAVPIGELAPAQERTLGLGLWLDL